MKRYDTILYKGSDFMKNPKDMVKYDNNFNLTSLNELNNIEQDILFTFCSQFTKNQDLEAKMTFAELREKAFLTQKHMTWSDSIQSLKSLGEKIVNLKFTYRIGSKFGVLPLFIEFHSEGTAENEWHDDDYISVSLNPKFARFLYDIPEKIGFTIFELQAFLSLKSKYAKTLFRFFLQNFNGKWTIGIDDLRGILGFSSSYSSGNIIKYIKKVLPELEETGYFSDIELDYTTKNIQGRPIKDVIFSYRTNKEKALEAQGQTTLDYEQVTEKRTVVETTIIENKDDLPQIQATENVIETPKACPYCGSKVIARVVTGDTPNRGRKYEKCEKNDFKYGNDKCSYFNWIE
jgi:plasmid replication initiation protein